MTTCCCHRNHSRLASSDDRDTKLGTIVFLTPFFAQGLTFNKFASEYLKYELLDLNDLTERKRVVPFCMINYVLPLNTKLVFMTSEMSETHVLDFANYSSFSKKAPSEFPQLREGESDFFVTPVLLSVTNRLYRVPYSQWRNWTKLAHHHIGMKFHLASDKRAFKNSLCSLLGCINEPKPQKFSLIDEEEDIDAKSSIDITLDLSKDRHDQHSFFPEIQLIDELNLDGLFEIKSNQLWIIDESPGCVSHVYVQRCYITTGVLIAVIFVAIMIVVSVIG